MDVVERTSDLPSQTFSFGIVEQKLRRRSALKDRDEEEGKGEQREDRGTDDNGVSLPLRNNLSTYVISIGNGKE